MTTDDERSAAMLALANDQARALAEIQRMREAAIQLALKQVKAENKDCMTVGALVAVLIGETAKAAARLAVHAATPRADAREAHEDLENADKSWNTTLKGAVARRELLVRELAALGPSNETPDVLQWTASSAAYLPDYVAALVVLKADARRWLAGLGIPLPPSLQDAGEAMQRRPAPAPASRIHSTKGRRAHWLDAVLKTAQAQAADPNSAMSVWHELCSLAASTSPPEPLMGMMGKSIKRRDGASHKLYDYDAFAKYFGRRPPPENAA